MCRHLAYLGPPVSLAQLVTAPAHSLYEQSWAPREQKYGVVNADGFGIGWYPPEPGAAPARYRRSVPIWTDPNVPELANAIRSHAVIAAVRSATVGTSQEECAAAPFRDGRYLFSHNGVIPDWTNLHTGLVADELLSLEARCDSALLWVLIYRELRRGVAPGDALAAVVRDVAAARPAARLNLLLTDGQSIAATRYGDTLWYRAGPGSVLVASEPDDELTEDWREVPDRTLLLADRAGTVRTTTLEASYAAAEK
jgi:ergothioneine biosynthesis protein EgtC